jgi:hypothetical protein
MTTLHPRINVTLSADILAAMTELSVAEGKSVTSIARELMQEALELREDKILSAIGTQREAAHSSYVSHQDIWGE